MSRKAFLLVVFLAALAGGIIAVGSYSLIFNGDGNNPPYDSIAERQQIALANLNTPVYTPSVPDGLNFVSAAESATKAVVHIRSKYEGSTPISGILRYRNYPSFSQGSGVIVSDDGYIATNNHVIDNANTIEVTLWDNRKYDATVIGVDPSTDLGLIKIDEEDLDFIPYGDSDRLRPGEWVLAVGNPFNLTSTVTAGIISAKARNIGILAEENGLEIEAFLQTDAAVNPGNSGGALVDLDGNLVGINTAIASETRGYSGYSFAVPVSLVRKVMDDLLEFGVVQRGLLGIRIQDASVVSQFEEIDMVNGVYVSDVTENSAALAAGIRSGDIIIAIEGKQVNNVSELQELVAQHRPGDNIRVTFVRNGREFDADATLRNPDGNLDVVVPREEVDLGGASFENLSSTEAQALGVDAGVRITKIESGIWEDAGIEEGFVITEVDKTSVGNVDDLRRVFSNKSEDRIVVLGVDKSGDKSYYVLDR